MFGNVRTSWQPYANISTEKRNLKTLMQTEVNTAKDLDRQLVVRKSNKIVEAKYRLNLREQKFILYMVSMLDNRDSDFRYQRVKISDFESVLNLDGKKWGSIYQVVKEITESLNDKPLTINKEDGKKLIINWIASAEIEPGSGVIEFEFSDKLKPYLLQLREHFTQYELKNILQLKSSFSIRMYEILKAHEYQRKVTFEVEELKQLLGVDDKYDVYYDFKKRVLNTAQKELKEKSDIAFKFKEKRQERKIHSIFFEILKNSRVGEGFDGEGRQADAPKAEVLLTNPVIERLIGAGFAHAKAAEVYQKGFDSIHDEAKRQAVESQFGSVDAWLIERLEFLATEMAKGKLKSPQGFFLKSLEAQYTSAELEARKKEQEVRKRSAAREASKKQLEADIEKLSRELWEEKSQLVESLLKGSEMLQSAVVQETAKGGLTYRSYDASVSSLENFSKGGSNKMAVFTAVTILRATDFQRFKEKEIMLENLKKRR